MSFKFFICSLAILLVSAGCRENFYWQDELKIITVRNVKQALNVCGTAYNFETDDKKAFTLLARDGHILQIGNEPPLLFQLFPRDGKEIRLDKEHSQSFLYKLNQQNAIIVLNNTPAAWQWLAETPEHELSSIRSLVLTRLDEHLKPVQLAAIKKLAGNKHLGLVFVDFRSQNLIDILSLIKPSWLYLGKDRNTPAEENRLSYRLGLALTGQRQLKTLILTNFRGPVRNGSRLLSFFSGLKSLCVPAHILEEAAMGVFPSNLSNLEELVITGDLQNQSFLKNLHRLKQLVLRGTIKGKADAFGQLRGLKALHFYGSATAVSSLTPFTELQSFVFPKNISQQDFAAICQERRELRHVELINCMKITDLAPLLNLTQLEGLVLLNGSLVDTTTLTKLSKLKYLILSSGVKQSELHKIKTSLPRCQLISGKMYSEPGSFDSLWPAGLFIGSIIILAGLVLRWTKLNKKNNRIHRR